MSPKILGVLAFSLLFYLLMGVIMMNIVTGITIDTFGALREETNARAAYMSNTAFVSEFTRNEYSDLGVDFSFDRLIDEEQHLWNYVYFLCHLRLKDPAEYTGPETMVWRFIQKSDPQWMPFKLTWAVQVDGDNRAADDAASEDPTQRAIAAVDKAVQRISSEQRASREVADGQHTQTQRELAELKATLKTLKQDFDSIRRPAAEDDAELANLQALFGNT